MVDVLPRQLRHVDETVHAAEVDEGAEVDDGGDHTAADLAGGEVGQEVLALFLLGLFEEGPPAQHDVVAVLVELDDLRFERLADVGLQVADTTQLDEGGGEEATETDVDDQAALDDLDDRTGDDAFALLDLLDGAPGALVLGALLGQDEATFLVLLLEDEGLDLVAEVHDLGRIDLVADRELAGGDDALGLEADVEQDLVLVDAHDVAGDELAVVDRHHGSGVGVVERALQIVLDDLAGHVLTVAGRQCLGIGFDGGGIGRGHGNRECFQ